MRLFFFLPLFGLMIFSCKKAADNSLKKAKIIWTGSVTYDGCDWLVEMESGILYHPESLDPSFQHNSLDVFVSFDLTGKVFACGFRNAGPEIIHIRSIQK